MNQPQPSIPVSDLNDPQSSGSFKGWLAKGLLVGGGLLALFTIGWLTTDTTTSKSTSTSAVGRGRKFFNILTCLKFSANLLRLAF